MEIKTKSGKSRWGTGRATKSLRLVKGPRGSSMLAVRKTLAMNRTTFARLLSVSERHLATIETQAEAGDATRRKMSEVQRLCDALKKVIDPRAIGPWMQEPNRAFGGLKPLEVIERGEIDRLWRMIYQLESGNPA